LQRLAGPAAAASNTSTGAGWMTRLWWISFRNLRTRGDVRFEIDPGVRVEAEGASPRAWRASSWQRFVTVVSS